MWFRAKNHFRTECIEGGWRANMKRATKYLAVVMAVALLLAGTAVMMAQAQAKDSEADLYTAWYNEKDAAKKADVAKKYLEKYPKGQYAAYMQQSITEYEFTQFAAAWQNHNAADLFSRAKAFLASPPEGVEPVTFYYWPALESHRLTRTRDFTLAKEGREFTQKAITDIEAGKIPAMVQDKAKWDGGEKNKVLGLLYQNLGLIDAHDKMNDQAIIELQKALALDPSEPYSAFQLGLLYQDKYSQDLSKYNALTDKESADGKAQLETLHKDADDAIDALGRFLALTDGKTGWNSQRTSVQNVLNEFWKTRHPDDPNGAQKAVDKYKTPAGAAAAGN
jgi:tetratricopeptide (TPR) repeat protein